MLYIPHVTTTQKEKFSAALKEARDSFKNATRRRGEIVLELAGLNDEITRLRRTITALAAMCSESPGIDKLGITDAVMEVMNEAPIDMTTQDVVEGLDNLGFDLESQKNVNASVHTVLSRLAKAGKITKNGDGDKTTWRGPRYVPGIEITDEDIPF